MESRYGIGINNRYAMFLDEDGEGGEDHLGSMSWLPVSGHFIGEEDQAARIYLSGQLILRGGSDANSIQSLGHLSIPRYNV